MFNTGIIGFKNYKIKSNKNQYTISTYDSAH